MIVIQDSEIRALGLKPQDFIDSVRYCFVHKRESQLPPKISLHPRGDDFINTMPCLLPPTTNRFGVKIVSRAKGRTPALKSDSMLYDVYTGELLAVIDCDYVTTMRTGAVAALAVKTLQSKNVKKISLMGLGNTGRATMMCLSTFLNSEQEICLLRYKDQAEQFVEHFKAYKNLRFTIVDSIKELFDDADVIISCITQAEGLFFDDADIFKPGVLIVPVHTRGFQNCDTTFDKVVCDDVGHVKGFKYFSQFKSLTELGDILRGDFPGRQSEEERIIDYNIGLGLHDAYICSKIYDTVASKPHDSIELRHTTEKYIV